MTRRNLNVLSRRDASDWPVTDRLSQTLPRSRRPAAYTRRPTWPRSRTEPRFMRWNAASATPSDPAFALRNCRSVPRKKSRHTRTPRPRTPSTSWRGRSAWSRVPGREMRCGPARSCRAAGSSPSGHQRRGPLGHVPRPPARRVRLRLPELSGPSLAPALFAPPCAPSGHDVRDSPSVRGSPFAKPSVHGVMMQCFRLRFAIR